jgi:hypothetical protein
MSSRKLRTTAWMRMCVSAYQNVGLAQREYASNDEAWCVAWLCLPGAQPKTERFV